MGLAEALSNFQQNYGNSGGNDDEIVEPFDKLKNGYLRLGSGRSSQSDFYARILPSDPFYKDFEQIGVQAPTKTGDKDLLFQSARNDNNDPLRQAVSRWGKRIVTHFNKVGMEKGAGFRTRFLLNVIPLVNQGGQFVEETDEQGNYKVYVLNLSYSQFKQLEALISNPANNPQASQFYSTVAQQFGVTTGDDWSFLSPQVTYPVHFSGTIGANNMFESHIDLQATTMLAPLRQGWESQLEDLNYQATPSYQYKAGVVDWVINYQDELLGFKQPNQQGQGQQAFAPAPAGVKGAPQSGPFAGQPSFQPAQTPNIPNSPVAEQYPVGGQQAPVMPQQPQSPATFAKAPMANQTSAPATPNAPQTPQGVPTAASLGFTTATAKAEAQAPQTPQQSQAPTVADPFASTGTAIDISEDDLPF